MVLFLANRRNLQARRLHDRLKQRLEKEASFQNVRRERANARDNGRYRVKGEVDPRVYLSDASYPVDHARLEVGFELFTTRNSPEYYWMNWVEPDRSLLVGWHQDGMHSDLGQVHLHVNHRDSVIDHAPAKFIDAHPLDVFGQRLKMLPDAVRAVRWQNGAPAGLKWTP